MTAISPVYETEPIDVPPDFGADLFLNAVVIADFAGEIRDLAVKLLDVEKSMGRVRSGTKTPRLIDVDIIYAGQLRLREASLEIPHPRWSARKFVMQPLADVRPELKIPGEQRTVKEILLSWRGNGRIALFARAGKW